MAIEARYLDLSNSQELEAFSAFIIGEGRIFQTREYLEAVGSNYQAIIAIDGDEIVGALPLAKSQKFRLKAFHIPPYTHAFGPIIKKDILTKQSIIIEQLLGALNNPTLLDFKLPIENEDILSYKRVGATVSAMQTHIVNAINGYDINSIHSSKKRYLKKLLKAKEEGRIVVKEGKECLMDLVWLQEKTSIKSGFKYRPDLLMKLMKSLGEDQYFALVLYTDMGEPISGAFCPYDSKFAYHVINASINHEDNLLNRSNILSTFLAVSKARELNIGFDFEGSSVPGVAEFYRHMGGVPKLFYRIQIAYNLIGKAFFAASFFK